MNKLPVHLLHEIFFRLQPTSLANLRCVDKSLHSHISDDQFFQSQYFFRLGSTLLKFSADNSLSSILNHLPIYYYIIGCSSGLLLLNIGGLCVVNPLTKKYKFIDHSSAKLFPNLLYLQRLLPLSLISVKRTQIGFAVDKIDRNKQRFKLVCLFDQLAPNRIDRVYQFEIYSEDSWRISQTSLICSASEIHKSVRPVYVNGCLYWLRIDGSIIVFDVESEESRLIPVEFPEKSKVGLCEGENRVNLVCLSNEKICVYVLKKEMEKEKGNILWRWNLEKEMKNVKFYEEGNLLEGEILGYENKCKVWGSIHRFGEKWRDFYMIKPCWDYVVGLDEMLKMNDEVYDIYGRITKLTNIIRIIRYRW